MRAASLGGWALNFDAAEPVVVSAAVPLPGTLLLMLGALGGLGVVARRRAGASAPG